MTVIKYKPLFDLEFLHSFYLSGKCADIVAEPTLKCRALLTSLGLRFLPAEFGGKLLAKVTTTAGKDIIKNPIPEGTKFTFILKLKNRFFENFTDINSEKPKTNHYYFSNLINNISADNLPLLTGNTTSKIVSETDLLPFVSNSFSYVHSSTAAAQTSELAFTDSGESFQQSLNNYSNVFNFSYDLKRTSGGRAKFFVDGTEKASVYVIDAASNKDVFAVLEIFYKSSLPAEYQFQKSDNSIETKFYKIAFASLATKWRYIISKKFNKSVTAVSVGKANGTPITFAQGSGALDDQFIMVSDNPLPLKEQPVAGIKLSDQTNKVIIANLPNPPLMLVTTQGADTFSDILITI